MKLITIRALALAGAALLATGAAAAQSGTLDKAANILERQARAGKGEFITYLVGAAAAYRWANKDGDDETAPLYCPTSEAKLDGRAWARIALEEYKQNKSQYAGLQEYPLSVFALALLHGLQSKYPCSPDEPEPSSAAGDSNPPGVQDH
jgi:hypothetical protein